MDCTGIAAETHDWALAGSELPLLLRGGDLAGKGPAGGVRGARVAGRDVELVEACTETGVFGRMITSARQLVEIDHVDAVVGGMGASDGVVLREVARRYPTVPFLVAGTAVREATAHVPAPNVYRFSSDVEQDQAGLATYAYRTLGWRHAAVVAEDVVDGWGAVAAFSAEFCALGGSVQRIWTPVYGAPGPLLKQVPTAVDGVAVLSVFPYGTPTAFIRAYLARRPDAKRSLLLGLWIYAPFQERDYAALWPEVHGVVARLSGIPDPSRAENTAYRNAFASAFPGLPAGLSTNPLVLPYYTAVDALLQALESIDGDARHRSRRAAHGTRLAPARNADGPGPPGRQPPGGGAGDARAADRQRSPGPHRSSRCSGSPRSTRRSAASSPRDFSPTPRSNECSRATPPPWAR